MAQVNAAYAAGNDPVTIYVDPGSYSWSGLFGFKLNKGVELIGAASPDSPDYPGTSTTGNSWTVGMASGEGVGESSKLYRVSGFSLNGVYGTWVNMFADGVGVLLIHNLRIDHNTLTNLGNNNGSGGETMYMGVRTDGHLTDIRGVIDNNSFSADENKPVLVSDGRADNWTVNNRAGTEKNLYFESNTITFGEYTENGAGCSDGNWGAAIVIRYNTSTNCRWLMHGHYTRWEWGVSNFELYGNELFFELDNSETPCSLCWEYRALHHQGSGEWYVFDNIVHPLDNPNKDASRIPKDVRVFVGQYSRNAGTPTACDGTDVRDGNRPGQNGYPCFHQPGRDGNQDLKPWYAWNNKWGDGTALPIDKLIDGKVTPDRDVYKTQISQNTSTTSPFNGSTGMGFGVVANRPTSCTRTPNAPGYESDGSGNYYGGVGYFATDVGEEGTLYRCQDTDDWVADYTPYTYPHPLVGGAPEPGDPDPPNPISGLSVVPF